MGVRVERRWCVCVCVCVCGQDAGVGERARSLAAREGTLSLTRKEEWRGSLTGLSLTVATRAALRWPTAVVWWKLWVAGARRIDATHAAFTSSSTPLEGVMSEEGQQRSGG